MVRLIGGVADGRTVNLDNVDLLPTIRVALVDDDPVVLGTEPDPELLGIVDRQWESYHRWPQVDQSRPVTYRTERPYPRAAASFSASA